MSWTSVVPPALDWSFRILGLTTQNVSTADGKEPRELLQLAMARVGLKMNVREHGINAEA